MSTPDSAPTPESTPAGFDFDAWQRLAVEDPPAFFAKREEAISACINSNPSPEGREQMLRLQDQIDGLRLMSAGPDRALQGIATLLTDHLHALTANLAGLGEEAMRLSALLKQVQSQARGA
jgi:hypothetical protein